MRANYHFVRLLGRNEMKRLTRGILIVFEGIDGSGKTTQVQKLAKFLQNQNYSVTVTHEPNHSSPYYQLIKDKVKKHREGTSPEQELEWYIKDRSWDLENNILPALKKKHIVLVDRYFLSNAAYQGALKTLSLEYVLKQNDFAKKPDLWVILDVSVSLGQQRLRLREKKKNEDQLELAEYQEKVRENYKKLITMDIGGEVLWIDASIGEDELANKLEKKLLMFIKKF